MNSSTASRDTSPESSVEAEFVAEIELDLSDIRSRITDMTIDSQSIVDELLTALAPLHRHVVDVIDLSKGEATIISTACDEELLALAPLS